MRLLGALVVLLLLGSPRALGQETAQPEFARVEVVCTTLSGNAVYLNHGRDARIEPGDRVRLLPLAGAARVGRIASVSRTSSRADFAGGLGGLDIGSRGVVWVPRLRLERAEAERALQDTGRVAGPNAEAPDGAAAAAETEPPPSAVPEHPPWTSPPPDWNQSQPLLAPAHGLPPEERPRRLSGVVFGGADWTDDQGDGSEREFLSGSTGLEMRLENPFGEGGQLDFDGEFFARSTTVDGDEEREDDLRVDRASYSFGGERGRSNRAEIGRFLQNEFPELGFLDGIEVVRRLRSGSRVGASLGYQPEPDDFFSSGNDLQAALFGRYVSSADERLVLGTGYQKTWHEGTADRDLFVAQFELHPSASTSLVSSLLLDYYDSSDQIKSSGFEVTQFFLNATQRTAAGHGLGLSLSHFRFPDLLRNEFPDVTAQEIADDHTSRVGLDGWLALTDRVQLYGRADHWTDQDDSGGGGNARLTLRDLLFDDGQVALESFVTSGKFSTGTGLRASLRKRFARGGLGLSWDTTRYDQEEAEEELFQHAARMQLDYSLGRAWFFSIYAEERFGDEQDALSLGFLVQRSFD